MVQLRTVRRVVIVVDAVLRERVLEDVTALGVGGYNYSFCHGKGVHAVTGSRNCDGDLVRIEMITDEALAGAVLDYVHEKQGRQFGQYAFSAFIDTVEVDPTDKSFAKHG